MNNIFEHIINMSLTGSVIIVIVLLARLLMKGFPKKYSYALWSIVAFRLCCPFGIKSVFSIFNFNPVQSPADVSKADGTMNFIHAPLKAEAMVSTSLTPANIIGSADSTTSIAVTSSISMWLWIAGAILLLGYGIFNYIRIRKNLSNSTKYIDNIYQSERISTPFILGIIKPKIYIPYDIDCNKEYVLAHEKYHIKRFDHIIKFLSFAILCIHWFNPLCWLAFNLMSKDMEMSCDEKVLSGDIGIKKEYSSALLSFATGKKIPAPSPLCFGEGSVKGRIKNILKYKKPKMVVSVIAVILVGAVIAGCSLNPSIKENIPIAITSTAKNNIQKNAYMGGKIIAQSPILSSIAIDASKDYNKVIINSNKITITDINGETTIDSQGELRDYKANYVDDYTIESNNALFLNDDLKDYFDDGDSIKELVVSSQDDDDISVVVYLKNDIPFAIGDRFRIFELIPYCNNLQSMVSEKIKEINYDGYPNGDNYKYYVEAHDTLQIASGDIEGNNKADHITVFTYPYYAVLENQDNILCITESCVVPTAITFKLDNGKYTYESFWKPSEDTKQYKADLNKYFPYSIYSFNVDNVELYNQYLYKIKQEAYKSAIEQAYRSNINHMDYNESIREAIDCLCKNNGLSGKSPLSTNDYDGPYYSQYEALICYGEYTMKYIYTEFLKGGNTDIHGDVMAHIMKKIIGDELKGIYGNGQEYFDKYLDHISNIYNKNKSDKAYIKSFKDNQPYDYLLLEMAERL